MKNGDERGRFLKRKNIFGSQGENCYYHPFKLPSEPKRLFLKKNIVIAANVRFVTHDIISHMLENSSEYSDKGVYNVYYGNIIIDDDVFIGSDSIIMYNVRIGKNSIIAAGSVVTKDVAEGVIVGGNPAVIIGETKKLVEKRISETLK